MSRIGKIAVHIPAGVKVAVDGNTVSVEGPKGKLSQNFADCVEIKVDGGLVHVAPLNETRFAGAMHGTARAIINNMATFDQAGIDDGYLDEIREGDKFTVEAGV